MAWLFKNIYLSILLAMATFASAYDRSFSQNYYPYWGFDHFKLVQDGDDEVQLVLDKTSGGAGFRSKLEFLSGRFHINMKLPKQKSKGLIPNFYLMSEHTGGNHCELDFEFIGTTGLLQTNVYANDSGGRQQGFQLWFDPSDDFHSYTILWNQHQVVFFVDDIPIRSYKNRSATTNLSEPMHIEATIWDADWAGPINWTAAPYTTYYRNFEITGCPVDKSGTGDCNSPEYEWNAKSQWDLNPDQKQKLQSIQDKYMLWDYCKDSSINMNYPECFNT